MNESQEELGGGDTPVQIWLVFAANIPIAT